MSRQYSCFFITPIGVEGSDVNERANDVYELIVIPALSRCGIDYLRGDHNASSSHIGMDVIRCIREADICLVDISYPNCNVYYELGLADALDKPVILMKEATVDAATLPADVVARKYISYSTSRDQLASSRSRLIEFAERYVQELDVRGKQAAAAAAPGESGQLRDLMEEIFTLRQQLNEKEAAQPALPRLPMDLRPGQTLTPMQAVQSKELLTQLDRLTDNVRETRKPEVAQRIHEHLALIRSTLGDDAYRTTLRKHCGYTPCIWEEYLSRAVEWLEVDMAYCALDVTWLSDLFRGVEMGFVTEKHYPDLERICDRVAALSKGRFQAVMLDPSGVERYYDQESAHYYLGLLAITRYQKTCDRRYYSEAADHWMRLCPPFQSSPAEGTYTRRERHRIEAELLLAEAARNQGKTRIGVEWLQGALKKLDALESDVGKRGFLQDAYMLSMSMDESLQEQIAAQLSALYPERMEDIRAMAQQEHTRYEAAMLLRDIAAVIPVPQNAVDQFKKLFPQKMPYMNQRADKISASSSQVEAFHTRTQELMAAYKADSDAARYLRYLLEYLVKIRKTIEAQAQKDPEQQLLRNNTVQLLVKIGHHAPLSEQVRGELLKVFPEAEAQGFSAARSSVIDTRVLNQLNAQLNLFAARYPAESKEAAILKVLATLLKSILDKYAQMEDDLAALFRKPEQ